MASMRDLFPLYDYRKKTGKNFIKENIQKVKGCNQCFLEKKMLKLNNNQEKYEVERKKESNSKVPSIKCNVKIIEKEKSRSKTVPTNKKTILSEINEKCVTNQSCQTDCERITINCQSCGQIIDRKNAALKTSFSDEPIKDKKNSPSKSIIKKDSKKPLDLTNYRMGEIPKYLKERNAKLELLLKEKQEQEKLAELQGLNDPKCPPGHMLMSKKEIQETLEKLETEFNSLIRQMNMMPVSSDSYKIKQRKIQLEKNLKELEEQIELMKTGKVFIKIPQNQ